VAAGLFMHHITMQVPSTRTGESETLTASSLLCTVVALWWRGVCGSRRAAARAAAVPGGV
jgi:hypothetical protein